MAEADLPHFLPFRMAYEVRLYFPLCHLNLSRPSPDSYVLQFEIRRNHPIYKPAGMAIRVDMGYIQTSYPDSELCVIELLEALIKIMSDRIRPNTTLLMLREYAPWIHSPNRSHPHPKIQPSADTSQQEPTQE